MAPLARKAIFRVDVVAALGTRVALPVVQLDESAAAAVGAKHLGNENKEVVEPAFGQRCGNSRTAFAFAETFILDVGMRDAFVLLGRMRIEGDDSIFHGAISLLAPLKPDFKRPEIGFFQLRWRPS